MPKAKGSEYMELFILTKNKARLEQEKMNLIKRTRQIDEELASVDRTMAELELIVHGKKLREVSLPKSEKADFPKIQVMKINY